MFALSGLSMGTNPGTRLRTFFAIISTIAVVLLCGEAYSESPRRIEVSLESQYFLLDSNFFGLKNAFGADAAFRYEIGSDIYFENGLGVFHTKGNNASVGGLDYHLNFLAIFPVLIPYRPVARLGIGLLSVNPVTVTPTSTFRPTQTTFYILGGAGVTRSVLDRLLVEASANFWLTPYEYRIYRFNRYDVTMDTERFMHVSISLGLAYAF